MPISELNAKGLRAYSHYFVWHFAQLFLPMLGLQLLTSEPVVGQLGMGLSWGWALYRTMTRFFWGQGRAPTAAEGRHLALVAALYSAVLTTAVRGVIVAAMTYDAPGQPEVALSVVLAVEFLVTALGNTLTLVIFFLPFIQEQAFAVWRERNP